MFNFLKSRLDCIVRRAVYVTFCLAVVSVVDPLTAVAQSTVGFQLSGGPIVSAGATFRLVPELDELVDPDVTRAEPVLLSQRNRPGFHASAGLLLNELLIYYRLERMGWKSDHVTCRVDEAAAAGTREAVELPNGQIDDIGVNYACQRRNRDSRSIRERDAWFAHSIGANYQIYADRISRPKLYAMLGGALALTTNHFNQQNKRARLGVRLAAGGGMDFYLEDNIAFNVELRYAFTVFGKDGDYTSNAYRVSEADHTVMAAVFEPMHTFSATFGVRIYLRR